MKAELSHELLVLLLPEYETETGVLAATVGLDVELGTGVNVNVGSGVSVEVTWVYWAVMVDATEV